MSLNTKLLIIAAVWIITLTTIGFIYVPHRCAIENTSWECSYWFGVETIERFE